MIKKMIIKLIKLYQKTPTKIHNNCRFVPTCSNYALIVIEDFGVVKGLYLTIKRLLKCNPWNKNVGIDLPPKKENYENK